MRGITPPAVVFNSLIGMSRHELVLKSADEALGKPWLDLSFKGWECFQKGFPRPALNFEIRGKKQERILIHNITIIKLAIFTMAHLRTGKGVPNMLWYKKRPQEPGALARPHHPALISGHAAFIALALRLQVRLVSYADNLVGGIDHITAGAGASSMASSSYQALGVDVRGQQISLARSYQVIRS